MRWAVRREAGVCPGRGRCSWFVHSPRRRAGRLVLFRGSFSVPEFMKKVRLAYLLCSELPGGGARTLSASITPARAARPGLATVGACAPGSRAPAAARGLALAAARAPLCCERTEGAPSAVALGEAKRPLRGRFDRVRLGALRDGSASALHRACKWLREDVHSRPVMEAAT